MKNEAFKELIIIVPILAVVILYGLTTKHPEQHSLERHADYGTSTVSVEGPTTTTIIARDTAQTSESVNVVIA